MYINYSHKLVSSIQERPTACDLVGEQQKGGQHGSKRGHGEDDGGPVVAGGLARLACRKKAVSKRGTRGTEVAYLGGISPAPSTCRLEL